MSLVGRDPVSATPNNDAQNKNTSLGVRSGVLGSEKGCDMAQFALVTVLGYTTDIKTLTACCWFFQKISDPTNLSIVGACRHKRDEPLVLYVVGLCGLIATFIL
jgi:hypothetical protein